MKISKSTGGQAALICAIAASTRNLDNGSASAAYHLGLRDDDVTFTFDRSPVEDLVGAAFNEAAA